MLSPPGHVLRFHQAHRDVPKAAAAGRTKPTPRVSRKPPGKERARGGKSIAADTGTEKEPKSEPSTKPQESGTPLPSRRKATTPPPARSLGDVAAGVLDQVSRVEPTMLSSATMKGGRPQSRGQLDQATQHSIWPRFPSARRGLSPQRPRLQPAFARHRESHEAASPDAGTPPVYRPPNKPTQETPCSPTRRH